MKCLVCGGAGFIGSNLVEALVEAGNQTIVLDNYSLGSKQNLAKVMGDIEVIEGDVRDAELIKKITKGVDCIFNQAAASSSPMFEVDLRGAMATNIDGLINILNTAKANNVRRVVYASSSTVYGNARLPLKEDMKCSPPNLYAASKLAGEYIAKVFSQEYGIETVGLRYMSIYGPHERFKGVYANVVTQFLLSMKIGKPPIIYGDGTQTRDFTYVKDAVQANILAMTKENLKSEVFNVGTGKMISFNQLIQILNSILRTEIKPVYTQLPIKGYMMQQLADISKIVGYLGFSPQYSLEIGIREILSLELEKRG